MIIRPLMIQDVEHIYQIECESFSVPWSKESIQQDVAQTYARYSVVLIVDEIVAYGGMYIILGDAEITHIAVSKAHRGKGIGRRLLKHLIEEAHKECIETISLEVRQSNQIARDLYTSSGFMPIAIRKNYYQNPVEDAIIMQYKVGI